MNPLPRDYGREPTILDPRTVHELVRELLDYANANRTWGVEVAEALADLVAARLSDLHSSLDPSLAREVLGSIRANWSPEPLAYVDALCTVLANLEDSRPFLRERMAGVQNPEVRALLEETLSELDRAAKEVDDVCDAVGQSTGALLLEGLPHQNLERALLAEERGAKPVREVGGFPFYREPLQLRPDDETLLRTIFSTTETLPPFSGEKLCGGFHPDFAVEWLGCDVPRCSLLCFGCIEVVSVAPGFTLRTDLARSPFLRLYEALRIYRKNRPGGFLDRFDDVVSQLRSLPNDA